MLCAKHTVGSARSDLLLVLSQASAPTRGLVYYTLLLSELL